MTPDELKRIAAWINKYQGWFWWAACCLLLALIAYCIYKFPTAEVSAAHHGHGKPGLLISAYVFLLMIPGLPMVMYLVIGLMCINNRIARFRMRKQDSLARLTKQHAKVLATIRKLEQEVAEQTEDLPPETIPVSMRDYSDRTSDY